LKIGGLGTARRSRGLTQEEFSRRVGINTQSRVSSLVTGSGSADRKLYTDNQSVVRQYKRPILVNGINNPTERGDFMDRALPVEFERIPKNERCAQSDLWAEFEDQQPELLGAVLDALSGAIRLRAPLAETPRLADWSEYTAAVYEHMGWGRQRLVRDWAAV
jgi:putative DNA primase/helicase